jgi:hypothetical protein
MFWIITRVMPNRRLVALILVFFFCAVPFLQIKQSISGGTDSVEEALRRTFLELDKSFCEDSGIDAREEGSTAVCLAVFLTLFLCLV